jgi:hypothetical protein
MLMRCLVFMSLFFLPPICGSSRELAAPQNLTLSALASGVWRLTWDPILDDSLMGYSLWSRREHKGEFTRITKQPLTRAIFQFKGLDPKRLAEFTVVAEYEEGRSEASKSAFTHLAWRESAEPEESMAPPAKSELQATTQSARASTAAVKAAVKAKSQDLAAASSPEPTAEATPVHQKPLRKQGVLLRQADWRCSLTAKYALNRVVSKGYGKFYESIPFTVSDQENYDLQRVYYWEMTVSRSSFSVPLELAYGLFPGVETGVVVAYESENAKDERATVSGHDYNTVIGGTNLYTQGLGDALGFVRVQPIEETPLLLGLQVSMPTGKSRFKGFIKEYYFKEGEAGNGLGVPRLRLEGQWGWKGVRQGLHLQGAYQPSVTENVDIKDPDTGEVLKHQAVHGDVTEIGLGFTFPWSNIYDGWAVAGILGRNIKAGRWQTNEVTRGERWSQNSRGDVLNFGGLAIDEDNQLELSLEAGQGLSKFVSTQGRVFFRTSASGYGFGIGGGLAY